MPSSENAITRSLAAHHDRWGAPELVVRAPGRVNLIGEHTDYNDGFALPMALPFDTAVSLSSAGSATTGAVDITSAGFGELTIDPTAGAEETPSWARHLSGAITLLAEHDVPTGGWRAAIDTDIPTGASLSSSAALEVAVITALLARAGQRWQPIDVAHLGQRIENEIVGLPSGIMDQFISAGAVQGHASLMDCRALTLTPAPLPDGVSVVILDTGTRRVLADVAYADRRASCERAAATLGVRALRDAELHQLDAIADATDRRRAHHVITENQRTLDAAEALRNGDVERVGDLMHQSHTSLRDDYEVSGPGLDAIVDIASSAPGCLGARMTGGGFAGCAVALVRADATSVFTETVTTTYDYDGQEATAWACSPARGVSVELVAG